MWCIVSNCYNDSNQTNSELSYHLFPKEPSLRTAWLEALHMSDWEPDECSAVCSIHFQEEDLLVNSIGGRVVRPDAVPVIDARVCRICFATDIKLYSMTRHKILSKEYDSLTGLLTDNKHYLPLYLCSECARRLLDCARFRTTSLQAHSLLLGIIKKLGNVQITLELIQSMKVVESLHSLIKSDYDLDIELTGKGNMYTDARESAMHVDIDGIKVENDDVDNQDSVITKITTSDDRILISGTDENIAEDGIKTENDEAIYNFNVDIVTNDNMVYISSTHQDVSDVIKAENHDVDGDTINDDIGCIPNRNKANEENHVKAERDNFRNQYVPIIEDSANPENEDKIVGEDYSLEDNLSLAEVRQKAKVNVTGVEDIERLQREVDTQQDQEAGSSLTVNRLYCGICPYETNSELLLLSHLKAHSAGVMYRCHICSYMTIHRNSLKLHLSSHSGTHPFSCDICNKSFSLKCKLKRHVTSHTDVKPFACYICNNKFKLKHHFTTHIRSHSSEKPFSCNICNKSFNAKGNLRKHTKTHFDEKPFSCYTCNKAFTQKSYLTEHIRTHSGKKPISCRICKKSFSVKCNLKKHIETHFDEKRCSCNICNKKFKHKHHLTEHIRTHSREKPFYCDISNNSFNEKGNLRKHIKTHFDKKPFSCNICNKVFNRKPHLTAHIRIHSGEKPFSCDICNKSFNEKGNLKKHIKIHFDERSFSYHSFT